MLPLSSPLSLLPHPHPSDSFNGFLTWFKLFKYLAEMGPVSLLINLLDKASTNLMTFFIIFLGKLTVLGLLSVLFFSLYLSSCLLS